MAHVHSYSQRDEDGIFLYDKNKRRIGGPYSTEEEATRASKSVSEVMGERPVEDYIEYLRRPQGLLGSTYDPAGDSPINYEALGIIPQEPTSLFNFVTDIKYDPKSFRVPVDPTPARWGADMSGVKFGTALPDRNAVEDMILEASGIAGVAPQYTEGYRTEAQNIKLGAHEESKHMMGQAFDLAISGNKERDKRYERELIRLFRPLGFSVKLKSDHVHLQKPPPSS